MNEKNITKSTLPFVIGSVICAALLALTVQTTEKPIAENMRVATEIAVKGVFPDSAKFISFAVDGKKLKAVDSETSKKAEKMYATYDATGKFSGVAIPAAGPAFKDELKILYGYNSDKECIIGFKVLKSTETAGYGDRISDPKETKFQESFLCLDARLNSEKMGLERNIETVASGKKTNGSQIDGIAGATVTSKGLGVIINKSAQRIIPIIYGNLSVLQNGNK
jgi:electron transport complex protein RnfG